MTNHFPYDAVAIWPMKDFLGNENAPFSLEHDGAIHFEKQAQDSNGTTPALLSDGDMAVLDNGCMYLHTYRARKFRPVGSELTLLVSAEWDESEFGTLFFSDFLALSIYNYGLAAAFVGVQLPDGNMFREIPLGYPKSGGRQIWILRISDGTLTFYANGTEYCCIPFQYKISAPFDSDMIFGGFQSLKPDTYGESTIGGRFKKLNLDVIALWHRGLTAEEIAALSGVSMPLPIASFDERAVACKIYNQMFDASVVRNVADTANAWRGLQDIATQDSLRPVYHLTQPFGHIFDPCGAFYYDNKYHVFSYHSLCNILDYSSLDHYVSDDLVHWSAYPIGPFADSEHDVFCIYLMNHFIDKENRARILYTGQGYKGKCGVLAESHDGLRSYTKKQAVLTKYHHDGHVFMHDDRYYTITSKLCRGTRSGDLGDPVMLWSSDDLISWFEESEIFCKRKTATDPVGFMEFPYLLSFGDRDVLLLGGSTVQYWVGHFDWDTLKFLPDHEEGQLLDIANPFHCFNPLCVDHKGENGGARRIIMALYAHMAGGCPLFWSGVHAQPRVLSLRGARLWQEPLPEMAVLRTDEQAYGHITIDEGKQIPFEKPGDALEIEVRFAPTNPGRFGIRIPFSAEESDSVCIYFDAQTRRFGVEGNILRSGEGYTGLSEDEPVVMRVFLDKQLLEVFVNGQTCTIGVNSFTPEYADQLMLFADKADCHCESLRIWKMTSAQ